MDVTACQAEIINAALHPLMLVKVTLTFTSWIGMLSLNCLWTSLAYHSWNLLFDFIFHGSIGCSLSVQLVGICTERILFSNSICWTSSVVWPLKQSKSTNAGWDSANFNSWHFLFMKGITLCSLFVSPLIICMPHIPSLKKLHCWVASWCFAFVN